MSHRHALTRLLLEAAHRGAARSIVDMKLLRVALGVLLAANGAWMLLDARHWYGAVPGVIDSGPLNLHFVRDIGAVYLLCGLAFLALARHVRARPYAIAGCAFLLAHGALHLMEVAMGVHELEHLRADVPGVLLLPLVASWAAWR